MPGRGRYRAARPLFNCATTVALRGPTIQPKSAYWDVIGTWRAEVAPKSIFSAREIQPKSARRAGTSKNGEGRNRTGDTTIFSRVLYQLSYLAARARW